MSEDTPPDDGYRFLRIPDVIVSDKRLSIASKLIYSILLRINDDFTEISPSISLIARLSNCSPQTVRRSLKQLEDQKLISRYQEKRGVPFTISLSDLLDVYRCPHEESISSSSSLTDYYPDGRGRTRN